MSERNDGHSLKVRFREQFAHHRRVEVAHPAGAQSAFRSGETQVLCCYCHINVAVSLAVVATRPACAVVF